MLGAIIALAGNCVAFSPDLNPAKMPVLTTADKRFQSFNVEMLEVTGVRFWKPYKDVKPGTTAAPPGGYSVHLESSARRVGAFVRNEQAVTASPTDISARAVPAPAAATCGQTMLPNPAKQWFKSQTGSQNRKGARADQKLRRRRAPLKAPKQCRGNVQDRKRD